MIRTKDIMGEMRAAEESTLSETFRRAERKRIYKRLYIEDKLIINKDENRREN